VTISAYQIVNIGLVYTGAQVIWRVGRLTEGPVLDIPFKALAVLEYFQASSKRCIVVAMRVIEVIIDVSSCSGLCFGSF
jgi:hypothetical protein